MILPENPYPEEQYGTNNKQGIAFKQGCILTARAIIRWGYETCPHGIGDFKDDDEPVTHCFKHACDECWEDLCREINHE